MAELTDDLVEAARSGDRDALGEVYRALAPVVVGYLRAKGVSDPEGSTNEVFLALLPRLPKITGGAAGLRRLTFSIAHARMVDDVRARVRAPGAVSYEASADTRTAPSAEDAAEHGLATKRVLAVLEQLPDDQREVLTLRVVADLTIDQIAEVMGRSPGAIKQLQRRGMITVRETLESRRVTL